MIDDIRMRRGSYGYWRLHASAPLARRIAAWIQRDIRCEKIGRLNRSDE